MKRFLFNTALVLAATLAMHIPGARGADVDPSATNAPASALPPTTSSNPEFNSGHTPSSGFNLDAFRIVAERNIFNPNRFGRTPEREYTRRDTERRIRTESIALVGTMSYDQGHFAFFDGSSSDYRRVVKPSETIAGLTVASVTPQEVVLHSSATNQAAITLPLGMQLQRHDEGKWEVTARTESTEPSSTSGSSSSSPGTNGGNTDVLNRLMRQREQDGGASIPAAEPAPIPTTESPTSSSSNAENDIVRRMMQRRERGE